MTMTMTRNGISINVDTTYTPIGISVLSLLLVLYIAYLYNRCQSLPVGIWHKFLKAYNDGKRLDLPPMGSCFSRIWLVRYTIQLISLDLFII